MVIIQQYFSNLKCVGGLAFFNEVAGADNGAATLPQIFRVCQLVQNIARFIKKVATDYVRGTDVYKVPAIDSIAASYVEIEKFFSATFKRFFTPCLLIHDA